MTTPNKNNNSNNRNFPPLPTPNRLNRSHSQATPSRRTPGGTRLLPPQRTVPTPSNTSSNSNGNNNNHGTPRSFLRQLTKGVYSYIITSITTVELIKISTRDA